AGGPPGPGWGANGGGPYPGGGPPGPWLIARPHRTRPALGADAVLTIRSPVIRSQARSSLHLGALVHRSNSLRADSRGPSQAAPDDASSSPERANVDAVPPH